MLYTSSISIFEKTKRKARPYYVIRGQGNDVVIPDESDLEQYKEGVVTWEGFKVAYLAKLMRSEAEEWMRRIACEAVDEDVVLVSQEENEHCYRLLLAEMMINMFSGQIDIVYAGELKARR